MKIKRFNESNISGIKWNEEKVLKTLDEYYKLSNDIEEYIKWKENIKDVYIDEIDYVEGSSMILRLDEYNTELIGQAYEIDNVKELFDFIDNPELYKEKNKYNI